MSVDLLKFSSGEGASDRLFRVLAFMQAHPAERRCLVVYDTRCRACVAAIDYASEVPVALLDEIARRVGVPAYVQAEPRRYVLGIPGSRQRIHGGFRYDGIELCEAPEVWRRETPRPA